MTTTTLPSLHHHQKARARGPSAPEHGLIAGVAMAGKVATERRSASKVTEPKLSAIHTLQFECSTAITLAIMAAPAVAIPTGSPTLLTSATFS
ncbi:hypothetical protein KC341_g34 [Hortaea werneckii]|nr:hypothetical protein KC341_g34 [Hortaea werneckii]